MEREEFPDISSPLISAVSHYPDIDEPRYPDTDVEEAEVQPVLKVQNFAQLEASVPNLILDNSYSLHSPFYFFTKPVFFFLHYLIKFEALSPGYSFIVKLFVQILYFKFLIFKLMISSIVFK